MYGINLYKDVSVDHQTPTDAEAINLTIEVSTRRKKCLQCDVYVSGHASCLSLPVSVMFMTGAILIWRQLCGRTKWRTAVALLLNPSTSMPTLIRANCACLA